MKSVTSGQMCELDRRTISEYGTPGEVLMERAGAGVADSIMRRIGWMGARCRGVIAVAGHGNNGGDACVVARLMKHAGLDVDFYAASDPSAFSGDAAVHFRKMVDSGVPVHVMAEPEQWAAAAGCKGRIIIDGLLGSGARGAARGAVAAAIAWINRMKQSNRIVSIDLPSGLDADTGHGEGAVVEADWTVTMGMPKVGLLEPRAIDFIGNLEVVDIGIPVAYTEGLGDGPEFLEESEIKSMVPLRRASSNKGDHGACLVIAGSAAYPGAAVLCALGAIRSGAGLVHVLTVESAVAAVASAIPEAIVRGLPADGEGAMDARHVREEARKIAKCSGVVVGPGLTSGGSAYETVEWAVAEFECGVVLDADALNVLARRNVATAESRRDIIMTPHPGEAGRLLGISAGEVQADRLAALRRLGEKNAGVMVLKGAGTLVGFEGKESINLTGNAGMARGGSGDVLAGLVGGLVAQGLAEHDAARLGVYVHGRAGDIAAWRGSEQGMTAGDVGRCMPEAFASLSR